MGFTVTIEGADFSGNGEESVFAAETFIRNAQITDDIIKNAYRQLYTDLEAAGAFLKCQAIYAFGGGTALSDSINLVYPALGISAPAYQITWLNDTTGAHTRAGYIPDGLTGRVANTNFPINGDINGFHLHVFNKTASTNTNAFLAGAQANATGNAFYIGLHRRGNTFTKGAFSPYSAPFYLAAPGGYDINKTGLLSLVRTTGGVEKLYDNGVVIAQTTRSDTWQTNGNTPLYVGGLSTGTSNPSVNADCTIRGAIVGFAQLTDSEVLAYKEAFARFDTAMA
ncbi:hypothetical protein [Runella sp.]|uniref:hypothetical protein n=1 Tax=Runella sp. TaxID=1960881 RepID=UPI003D10C1A9